MCAVVSMNAVSVGWGKRDKGIMVPCLDFTWGIASIGPSYLERTMAAAERSSEFVPECVQPPDLILRACDFIDFCVFRHEANQALTTPGNAENRIKSQILRRPLCGRLEGWMHGTNSRPSFETRARARSSG